MNKIKKLKRKVASQKELIEKYADMIHSRDHEILMRSMSSIKSDARIKSAINTLTKL